MLGTRTVALAVLSVAAAALAGPPDPGASDLGAEDAFPTAGTRHRSRLQPPGSTDARVGGAADILLSSASGVLAVDRGVADLAPGTLALGLEVAAGKCLLACGRLAPDLVLERLMLAPSLRLTYHFTIEGGSAGLATTGFYALLLGGAALSVVDEQDANARVRATTYSPLLSAGLGTAYFLGNSDEVFAGGEVRLTYMPRFSALAVEPPTALLRPESVAPLGGMSLVFFMGVRL